MHIESALRLADGLFRTLGDLKHAVARLKYDQNRDDGQKLQALERLLHFAMKEIEKVHSQVFSGGR